MKAMWRNISMVLATGWAIAAPMTSVAGRPTLATACANRSEDHQRLATGTGYPTFCSMPAVPIDVRDAAAFHAAVIETRLAGRRTVEEATAQPSVLSGASAFAAVARAEASPPGPLTAAPMSDWANFLRESRARATPPARRH